MRLIASSSVNAPTTQEWQFVDTNFIFGDGVDREKIYKIPIRCALDASTALKRTLAEEELLQILECP